MNIEQKKQRLCDIVRELGSVAVAFSAGTDSTYLLAVCCDVLGADNVLAVTAHSATLPREELEEASILANELGVRWQVVSTKELEIPDYVRNDTNRCFYCQEHRVQSILKVAQSSGLAAVAYGITCDDMEDHRPGIHAIQQLGVSTPLLDAGLDKADIRELSLKRGLSTHDKPSMACLATRIPYGRPIRVENLDQVAEAEAFLKRDIGLQQVRVRHYDNIARLEVEAEDILLIAQAGVRERIVDQLRGFGFDHVTLDLAGFRSGSMQEGLKLL